MASKRVRLAQRRKAAGYTQERLAEELGVDRSTVLRWERAESEPRPWQLPKLRSLLQVSVEELQFLLSDVDTEGVPRDGSTTPASLRRPEAQEAPGSSDRPDDKVAAIRQAAHITDEAARAIARMAQDIIELDLSLRIDIGNDGRAELTYRHTIMNVGSSPATRLAREVWFKHTDPPIKITPMQVGDTSIVIRRIHDTPTLAKFACQLSPPLIPGSTATVQYAVRGGLFLDELYWRQATPRYVHHLEMQVYHREAGLLRGCDAVEEHPDGSERSAAEHLQWTNTNADLLVTLTRDHLRPNQAVTLRWDVNRDAT